MQFDLDFDSRGSSGSSRLAADLDPAQARDLLEAAFGLLFSWRRRDPVSQLVRALIASSTKDAVSDAVLARLRERFRRWEALAGARPDEVLEAIAPVAFASDKAERLPRALAEIRRRLGVLRLDGLADIPIEAAMDWLQELPGVGQKVAASVLNASTLDRPVMIVDGHVLRVTERLGWTPPPSEAGEARLAVMEAAPSEWTGADFLELHRRLRALGQTVCRPERPDCAGCPLAGGCPDGAGRLKGGGERLGAGASPSHAGLRRRLQQMDRGVVIAHRGCTTSFGAQDLDAAFDAGGLPAGLHHLAPEAAGVSAASWLAPLAVAARAPIRSGVRMVVVQEADARREGGAPYGPGLEAMGVAADELAVVRAARAADALGAAEAALRLAAAPVVMLELRRGEASADLAATRRLDLLARRAGVFLFLLTPTLDATSAAVTRWRVGPAASQGRRRRPGLPAVRLQLLRNRAGRTGDWSLIWNPHERRFTPVAPLSAPVGASALDRSRAPDAERVAAAA